MGFIETTDLSIYHERSQRTENGPLLYIGGTAGDLRSKPNIMDSPLINDFEVIAYDQRGLGQTSKPENPYTMKNYADDAAGFLDALGINKIAVLGASFGGMVAQEFVLRHPTRVTKLVLACTSSGGAGGPSYPLHSLESLKGEEKIEKILRLYDTRITDSWIQKNSENWEQLKSAASKKGMGEPYSENVLKQLMARKGHDTFDRLKVIERETFLLGGEFDGISPKKNMEMLTKNISGSKLKFYQGGHLFLGEDPSGFLDITEWLLN